MSSPAVTSQRSTAPARTTGRIQAATLIGGALTVLAAAEVLVEAPRDERVGRAIVTALVVGVPIGVGLYAARSPQHARFGWLLAAAGAVWSLTALGESGDSVAYSIGRVAAWLLFPILFYLLLAYPSGRIGRRSDCTLLAGLDALVALLFIGSALFVRAYPVHTPWATCDARCPPNAFMLVDQEPAVMASLVQPAREYLAIALLVAFVCVLGARLRRASVLERRTSAPVTVSGMVSALVLAAYFPIRRAQPSPEIVDAVGIAWALCTPLIAAAFLVGIVQRRLHLAAALQRLSVALGRDLDATGLRRALAAALEDPGVEVLLPEGAPGRWRDSRGRAASTSAGIPADRAVMRIDDEDAVPLAGVVHDRALAEEADLLDAVSALVGSSLRHDRLKRSLARSLAQLEDSRHRIAGVADLERARIERDLHDGAQQRLIMLRVKLSLAEELLQTDPDAGLRALHDVGGEVDQVLDELRSLAHGVYPPLLSDRGLEDALRSVVATSPLPVELSVRGVGRLRREIETAVYFTVLEAFQNALKHATGATRLWISVRQNDAVKLEVRDDGGSFVPSALNDQGGLRNMRDRLEAVGGSLVIDASPGHGTRIRGSVPLEARTGGDRSP